MTVVSITSDDCGTYQDIFFLLTAMAVLCARVCVCVCVCVCLSLDSFVNGLMSQTCGSLTMAVLVSPSMEAEDPFC